ncbi:hypothetical protein OHA72_06040 [Dactylosporangium sp. NBC_01737]|uniref:hypothetical protein n=1 Tax=Dactylosporangium sp. NBC_01737 TaxID=2975959 RepID=UPI002E112481|nr:hypothetical protein OHA72_06040 [Dactylosporangium sp. NBC_01737]
MKTAVVEADGKLSIPIDQIELCLQDGAAMSRAGEFLVEREHSWQSLLRGVSLVAEVEVPDDEVFQALSYLGLVYRDADDSYRERLLRRYPAIVAMGLARVGAVHYEHGAFWPGVWREAGITYTDQSDQQRWGEQFRTALGRFGLARFPGLPLVNVSEILVHAGVPEFCLGDLLALLAKHHARNPGLDARQFMEWAFAPGFQSRLNVVDKPVRRFLEFGGDYAEDFVDRCIDLLVQLAQPAFDPDGIHLPARVIARATELAQSGLLELGGLRRARASAAREHPRLLLEPFGRGLLIWLPAVEDALDGVASWQLRFDGEPQEVMSRSPWPGGRQTAPATGIPVNQPVREVSVELEDATRRDVISVVDPGDPLLVFTEDGRRIPSSASITPEPVWLLHPMASEFGDVEVEFNGRPVVVEEQSAPYGWDGWRLRKVDLSDVRQLRLGGSAKWRTVQGRRRPRLMLTHPLVGVATAQDLPVHDTPPTLTLPGEADGSVRWTVRIRRPNAAQDLTTQTHTVTDDLVVDPWKGIARPAVGAFEVTVRGPLGRGLSQTVNLAEGLTVVSEPAARELRASGLTPCRIHPRTVHAGLTVTPATIDLSPRESSARIEVSGPDGNQVLAVTPPHMAVRLFSPGQRPEWSLRPLRLDIETLGEGELQVRLPAPAFIELVVRVGTADLQTIPPVGGGRPDVARFSLARIIDTVTEHGSARLDLMVKGVRMPAATCAPRQLATQIDVDGGRLMITAPVVAADLTAGVYQTLAPWRKPFVSAVSADGTTAPLPDEVVGAGPLLVKLRIEDPWLAEPWPDWPTSDNRFALDGRPLVVSGSDTPETMLSRFLAGEQVDLADVDAAQQALHAFTLAKPLRAAGIAVDVRYGMGRVLARDPASTLRAMLAARLSPNSLVAPLVHSGLCALPPVPYLNPDEELALWSAGPVAAMLASAHQWRHQAAPTDLLDRLTTICGDVAADILAGKDDPFAPVGRFEGADQLAVMPPEQLDRLWRAARVVPGGLLDADERLVAARELFDARLHSTVRGVAVRADRLLRELRPVINEGGGSRCLAAVRARRAGDGWTALSELSIAFALAARLAGHGHRSAHGFMSTHYGLYSALARRAPRLTSVDLVLAELLIAGA